MDLFQSSYRQLIENNELKSRVGEAYNRLTNCDICAHNCGTDRLSGELGVCKTGVRAKISSYGPHFGEEDPLRGSRGSGTIFFTRCNLRCQFCQNHDISQQDSGNEINPKDMAVIMLELQARGCHNINFVSPSHVVPQILAGILVAAQAGLKIPLVFNTGGYDSISSLRLLDGVFDIYMPDMKYADADVAKRFSKIPDYPNVNQQAVTEMHRQVGDLKINKDGIATRGLLIRHLVLPGNLAGTNAIIQFISDLSTNTYLNLMDQYHPSFKAHLYPEINRRITPQEYQSAIQIAKNAGLSNLDNREKTLFFF
jgi:putative pyruvate formate lyase activating enzyme